MSDYRIRTYTHASVDAVSPLSGEIDYYDFTFVKEGELEYSDGEESVTLLAGDAVVFRPKDHRYRAAGNAAADYISINFVSEKSFSLPRVLRGALTQEVTQLLSLFDRYYKGRTARREEKLSHLIGILAAALADKEEERAQNPHITRILSYIYTHYAEPGLSLGEIAKHVGLAPNYCSYLVKKELGVSIFEIILRERVLCAEELILQEKKSLEEIARLSGFSSYSYFSYTFKKQTGFAPSAFKKR